MSDSTDWVTAIATVGATVVSVAATFIAAKSASASQASADVAAKVLHRSAVRELVTECHELIAEDLRIQSLAIELRCEYGKLPVSTGTHGGSSEKMHMLVLDKDIANAAEKAKEARALVEVQAKLIIASDHDLDIMKGEIEAARTELKTIREAMVRHLENVRTQIQ
ncbi:MAG: hypothetical protein RLZZ09_3052 [Pseudomonadota bacterium]|jgi:hypothetical protein